MLQLPELDWVCETACSVALREKAVHFHLDKYFGKGYWEEHEELESEPLLHLIISEAYYYSYVSKFSVLP